MRTSFRKLINFTTVAGAYLNEHKAETKLVYALNRTVTQAAKLNDKLQELLNEIDVDCCATEKRGEEEIILRDERGNLMYSKEGLKQRNKRKVELLDREDVEFEPYFATKLPARLTDAEIDAFTGFVIKPEEAEVLRNKIEAEYDAVEETPTAASN